MALVKKHINYPLYEEDVVRHEQIESLEVAYDRIIDELTLPPITSENEGNSRELFFKRLATWMSLAMVGRALEIVENKHTCVKYLDINDVCKLADDLKGLQTITDVMHFIDGLDERARGIDGAPFLCWTVRDIIGTIHSDKFDDYYNEFLQLLIDTSVPAKRLK